MGAATNRRYSLTFSVNARNILNNVNAATPDRHVDLIEFRAIDCSGGRAVFKRGGESKN